MTIIDLSTWKRRQHFEFFGHGPSPYYNVNLDLDISGLKAFCKQAGISLNHCLMYLVLSSMHAIENFRYRVHGETIILHQILHPSFAHLGPGQDDLFSLVTSEYHPNLREFDRLAKSAIQAQTEYFPLEKLRGRDDFVFFSALPWFSFSAIDHTQPSGKDDGIPRVTWGMIKTVQDRELLPFNIQVNHRFVDGIHLHYLFQAIDQKLRDLLKGEHQF